MNNVSIFLKTNDIVEEFAERVVAMQVVKLVEINTSCANLSFGKNVNCCTGKINVIKVIYLAKRDIFIYMVFL